MKFSLLNRLDYLDYLIRHKMTGNPKNLAQKLDISERTLYNLILLMKDMGAPISYSRQRRSYYYKEEGRFNFNFRTFTDTKKFNQTGL